MLIILPVKSHDTNLAFGHKAYDIIKMNFVSHNAIMVIVHYINAGCLTSFLWLLMQQVYTSERECCCNSSQKASWWFRSWSWAFASKSKINNIWSFGGAAPRRRQPHADDDAGSDHDRHPPEVKCWNTYYTTKQAI